MIVVGKLGIGLHVEGPVIKVKGHIVHFEKKQKTLLKQLPAPTTWKTFFKSHLQ